MFSEDDLKFVDELFSKLSSLDLDMIDLHDDDTISTALEFEQLSLDVTN